jgi:hypothetical protein
MDPTATPAELDHYGAIARQLTGPRRRILELVDRCGPTDLPGLARCWAVSHPDEAGRLGDRLGHLTTGLLWKLEALDWVAAEADSYTLTDQGRRALTA